jgi:hypothetical protein
MKVERASDMARYIDAEALTDSMLEHYNELCEKHGDYDHYTTGYGDAIDAIENASTADVVPKQAYAEYEETTGLKKAKQEVAREILSDLKKKIHDRAVYTGSRDIPNYIDLKTLDAIIDKIAKGVG